MGVKKELILDLMVHNKFKFESDPLEPDQEDGENEPVSPTIGLLVGTVAETGEYCIVHVAETLEGVDIDYRSSNDNESSSSSDQESEPALVPKSFTQIKMESVAHHAKQVIRMLPGGLFILGIYVIEPVDNIFTTKYEGTIKGILATIKRALNRNPFYKNDAGVGPAKCTEYVVFHCNPKNSKLTSKLVETDLYKTQPLDISSRRLEWSKLECEYDTQFALHLNKSDLGLPLKKNLKILLESFQKKLELSTIIINGFVPTVNDIYEEPPPIKCEDTESGIVDLDSGSASEADGAGDNNGDCSSSSPGNSPRHGYGSDSGDSDSEGPIYKPATIHILVDKTPGLIRSPIPGEDFVSHLHLQGKLACVAFGIKGCSMAYIANMIQVDIIRSLASRLEMHCESLVEEEQLTEGDDGIAKVYHEIPRRVFTQIPFTRVMVSDYLFPGEGPKESVYSFRDILTVDLEDETGIVMTKEKPFNLDELHSKGSLEELMSAVEQSAGIVTESVDRQRLVFWIICLGILVAFVGVIMPVINSKIHHQ